MRLATITRRVCAVASPVRTSSTIRGTVKPCAIMIASVQPSRLEASNSSARCLVGGRLRLAAACGRWFKNIIHSHTGKRILVSRAPSNFRQSDVTRAVRAITKAGVDIARVEIEGGKITVIVGKGEAAQPAGDLDAELQEFGARNGQG